MSSPHYECILFILSLWAAVTPVNDFDVILLYLDAMEHSDDALSSIKSFVLKWKRKLNLWSDVHILNWAAHTLSPTVYSSSYPFYNLFMKISSMSPKWFALLLTLPSFRYFLHSLVQITKMNIYCDNNVESMIPLLVDNGYGNLLKFQEAFCERVLHRLAVSGYIAEALSRC